MKHKHHSSSSEQRKKLVRAGSIHWVHWLIITFSVLLTISAWYFSKQQLAQKVEQQFHREADQAVELVKERMELYANALWGGVALIDSNGGDIFYDQWRSYANSLHIDKTYPGINGIGVIFNIKPSQMKSYLAKERKRRPEYKLHPKHDKSEFWPITYVEPSIINKGAIGLDMAFEKNRYTGIKNARDTGKAQLTGPITLVQDEKKTPGFLFFTPFYRDGKAPQNITERRKNIIGVTYAPFIMDKLMQGTLSSQKRHVDVKISDNDELLYDDTNLDGDDNPLYTKEVNIDLYGRIWTFDILSNTSFRQAAANSQPYFILFGGIVIDCLLLALFIFLSRANRRALFIADKMTAELQIKTEHLERSNQELDSFAYVASHDLKAPLRGIDQLASWIREDIDDKDETMVHIKMMRNRVKRMEQLLNDLLAYSRVGHEEDKIQEIDCKKVFESLYEMVDPPETFQFELKGKFPVVDTVFVPFQLVFRNLIDNAIKHHDRADGKITISVIEQSHDYIFSVQDDGPGIAPEFHEKIFAIFQTLKPRDVVEGSGMGLAIIKKTVNHFGGEIRVVSDEKKGCRFELTWPKSVKYLMAS